MHIPSRAMSTLLLGAAFVALLPASASAQIPMSGDCKKKFEFDSINQLTKRALEPGDPAGTPQPWTASGNVTIICDDSQLFADEIEYYEDTKVVKARGHVNFIDGSQRISAERLEFNTETKLGTFYEAQGIMTIAAKPDTTGMFTPQDADAYFYGESIEKTGPDTYKFINGILTTCVQPTPRWQLQGSKVVLVKDKRALMWNAVFRVKNVPVFYLPFWYYPINKDDRNTGFLMPSLGHDTIRGQTLSEAFFLVLGRSMDATFNYERASKTGSDYGGEYRYVQAPGSQGNAQVKLSNGKSEADPLFASRRMDVIGNLTQRLPANWYLRGNLNYTNNVQARQVLQKDLLLSSDSSRSSDASLQGHIGRILITSHASITDRFTKSGDKLIASRNGTLPQIRIDLPSSPIGKSKVYFTMGGDLSRILLQDDLDRPETNRGLTRFDTHPTLRAPIGSLPYLSVTTSAGWQLTYWSAQMNAQGLQVKQPLTRQMFDTSVIVGGPKFSKVFDTPGSSYATRWKHVIEPTVSMTRLTGFDSLSKVARYDQVDTIVPNTTTINYGLANRLLAKRPAMGGQAVEVASIAVSQTYYSNSAAALVDTNQTAPALSPFSAVTIFGVVQPTTNFNLNARLDYDAKYKELRAASAGAGVVSRSLTANATWSRTFFIEKLQGFNNKAALSHVLSAYGTYRAPDNHLSTRFSWSYDFHNKHQMDRSVVVSYMSQCCGIAVDYRTRYLGPFSTLVPQSRIFKISFSLGGIGTFSPPSGLFGG
jgi:LPS-assembly protein